jgi:hypothetical protein
MVQEIEKMIKENLKPKEIKEEKSEFIGHEIISLIPIYEGKELKKSQKSIEELEKLKRKILLEENDNEKKLKEDKKEINEKEKIEEDLSPYNQKRLRRKIMDSKKNSLKNIKKIRYEIKDIKKTGRMEFLLLFLHFYMSFYFIISSLINHPI